MRGFRRYQVGGKKFHVTVSIVTWPLVSLAVEINEFRRGQWHKIEQVESHRIFHAGQALAAAKEMIGSALVESINLGNTPCKKTTAIALRRRHKKST